MTVENKVRSLTSLISLQLGFSLVPKDPVKQLYEVPVPQAELRETAISVRAAIIANIQLLKIDFLELFCHGDGFHHCEVLLLTGKSAEATCMSNVNRIHSLVAYLISKFINEDK